MIPRALSELLADLAHFDDRQDRIELLISIADRYDASSAHGVPRDAAHRVPGCESEAYVSSEAFGGGLKYRIAVDNPQGISAMALAVILDETLSGAPLDQVASVSEEIVFDIFGRELSMGKSLGLTGLVQKVKAESLSAK